MATLGYKVLKYWQYVAVPVKCHISGSNVGGISWFDCDMGIPTDHQMRCIVIPVPGSNAMALWKASPAAVQDLHGKHFRHFVPDLRMLPQVEHCDEKLDFARHCSDFRELIIIYLTQVTLVSEGVA